jgi:hypothetical protein
MYIDRETNLSVTRHSGDKPGFERAPSKSQFQNILNGVSPRKTAYDQASRIADRTRERNYMLEAAKADPREAEKLAHGYAHNSLGSALLDLSDRPNIRYSATGELVTSKTQRYFDTISEAMQRQCANLYWQEKSKDTPPAEILQKIFDFHDSMPRPFRDMLAL